MARRSSGTGTGSSGQIVVIGTDSYIVNTTVDDTEIGQIADGDQADITPTGATTPIYGTVGSISLIGSQTSDVTTFPVVIDVTGDPTGLYAGSSADVSIIVKQLNDVTEVPTAAISYSSSGQATVTEVVNGSHVVKDVTVGAAENGETQITSGVSAGAKVLEREITFKAPTGGAGGILGRRRRRRRLRRSERRRRLHQAVRRRGRRVPRRRSGRRHHLEQRWWRMTVTPPQGTPPVGVPEGAVIDLERVTKVYRTGSISVAALRGVSAHDRAG